MAKRLIATNSTRGAALTENARVADTILTRLVGLLRDSHLEPGDGLWIVPCNSIHSFAMRFVFDAIFLDKQLRVVHLKSEMKPWRTSALIFSAHSVLELPPGTIHRTGTQPGDQFEMRLN